MNVVLVLQAGRGCYCVREYCKLHGRGRDQGLRYTRGRSYSEMGGVKSFSSPHAKPKSCFCL